MSQRGLATLGRVCNDHEALSVTGHDEQSVVMLSLENYKALEETAYLLRGPANAKRLRSLLTLSCPLWKTGPWRPGFENFGPVGLDWFPFDAPTGGVPWAMPN
ncbi:MAG: type II toxin-antitoxin system Phd/YefM family antitoxin [Leptothrix sp. (in: b-proteobacteria)]